MPTFTGGAYTEPGTYIKVENQTTVSTVQPAFITALIGTTSTDKPVTKELTRGSTPGFRLDSLDTTVTDVVNVVDEYGVGYVENQEWQATVITGQTYVEVAANFVSSTAISGVTLQPFSGTSLNVGGTTYNTSINGAQNLIFTAAGTTLTWGGGAAVPTAVSGNYTLTDAAGGTIRASVVVAQLPATNTTDAVTVTTLGPAVSTDYTVSYRKSKTTTDLAPRLFDDLLTLQDFHGAVTDDSVNYPETSNAEALSIAATAYFDAGGGSVYTVPIKDKKIDPSGGWDIYNVSAPIADAAWGSAVAEALLKLEDLPTISCVIVLSPTERSATAGSYRQAIFSGVVAHINKMNGVTEGKPRMAILGARANSNAEATFTESAQYAANEYIMYLAPGTATKTISGFTKLLNGASIAAGLAGICSNPTYNAGEPISGKAMTMFDSITDPFSGRLQRNRVASYGVTLIEEIEGQYQVRDFLTTNQTSSLTGEGVVTRIKIDTRRVIRQTLNKTVINRRLVDNETIPLVRSLIGQVLTQKISDQVINEFAIEYIKVNSTDPTQLDVKVRIKPVFTLKYVYLIEQFVVSS